MGELRVTVDGAVATIEIDNPGKRNALTAEMWRQFPLALDTLAADDAVRVLLVRGAGRDFSAGADIGALDDILDTGATGDGGHVSVAENALAAFPRPTVAAIEGFCVGGGWQLAGACDIRIAADTATLGITPARLGIIYPLSGIERLVQLIGPAHARYLLFSGDLVPAGRAYELGMLARIVPAAELHTEAAALAALLAARSQLSIRAMKELIALAATGDRASLDAANARWARESTAGADRAIGAAAFLAHETPRFIWPEVS